MTTRVRLTGITYVANGFEADLEALSETEIPITDPPLPPAQQDGSLPAGYSADPNVAEGMFRHAMEAFGIQPLDVGDGDQRVIDALKARYPALDVYLAQDGHEVVWPGFGSIDITKDSGKGGWQFVPSGKEQWLPASPDQNQPPGWVPPPPASRALPEGYRTDENVAAQMLLDAISAAKLDAVAMQGHGTQIAQALNDYWPGLDAYAHPQTDAIMWPGFGSLDVTKDSGKGGWYFRPDHEAPWLPPGQR